MTGFSFAALTTFLMAVGGKILYSIFVLIICAIFIKLAEKFVKKLFQGKLINNKHISERKSGTIMTVTTSVVKYFIYFVAIISILSNFGVEISSIIATAGIAAVAVGFAAQSLVSDFISGFFILLEDQFAIGDLVTIQGQTGIVEALNMKTTRLRGADGTVYIIPNGQISMVINKSQDYINAIVDVGVDYGEDIPHVLEILNNEMEAFAEDALGLRKKPVVLGVTALDDSAVTIRIIAECIPENGNQFRIERELRLAIKNRLDKEGISIPFPQRTVHIVKEEA